TLFAIGPGHVMVRKISLPSPLKRPPVGLNPTTPFNAAGTLIDPPVSVASAMAQKPAATDTAAPPLDPPAVREVLCGLRVMPVKGLMVTEAPPYSAVVVSPTTTAPASTKPFTMAAERRDGFVDEMSEPHLSGNPSTS